MSIGLTEDQKKQLVTVIFDSQSCDLTFDNFSEILGLMLENISGFEAISDSSFRKLVDELWSIYKSGDNDMFSKQGKTEEKKQVVKSKANESTKPSRTTDKEKVVDSEPVIVKAVAEAKKLSGSGKTKADIARSVFGIVAYSGPC